MFKWNVYAGRHISCICAFSRGNRWQEASAAFPTLRMARAFITTECHLLILSIPSVWRAILPSSGLTILLKSYCIAVRFKVILLTSRLCCVCLSYYLPSSCIFSPNINYIVMWPSSLHYTGRNRILLTELCCATTCSDTRCYWLLLMVCSFGSRPCLFWHFWHPKMK